MLIKQTPPRTPQPLRQRNLFYILLIIVILVTACQQAPHFEDVYTEITAPSLAAGLSIPLPSDEPILTVTGLIGTTNIDDKIVMDRTTIEQVGLVEYATTDPTEKKVITFRGVLMRDLLDLWQVPESAETMQLTALNDYQVELPIAELRNYPILFALMADGQYMERNYRGPAMIVYPIDQYDFQDTRIAKKWIWQIEEIEVR